MLRLTAATPTLPSACLARWLPRRGWRRIAGCLHGWGLEQSAPAPRSRQPNRFSCPMRHVRASNRHFVARVRLAGRWRFGCCAAARSSGAAVPQAGWPPFVSRHSCRCSPHRNARSTTPYVRRARELGRTRCSVHAGHASFAPLASAADVGGSRAGRPTGCAGVGRRLFHRACH